MGCQSAPNLPLRKVSALDQKYKLQRQIKNSPKGAAVSAYHQVFSKTLYSHCRWFPSDSRYAQIAQQKCGAGQGALMAFSRFLYEEDATKMGYPIVINDNHLESVNFPHECWF